MAKDSPVTNVEFYESDRRGDTTFAGYASITLETSLGEFVVTGLRVFEREDGTGWVGMPAKRVDDGKNGRSSRGRGRGRGKSDEGEWKDICYPLDQELREEIQEAVCEEADVEYVPASESKSKGSNKGRRRRGRNTEDDDEEDDSRSSRRGKKRSKYYD